MKKIQIAYILLILALFACKKEIQEIKLVYINSISSKSAIVNWQGIFPNEEALNFQVILNDNLVAEINQEYNYKFENLMPNATYSGHIIATNNQTREEYKQNFSFSTLINKAPQDMVLSINRITGKSISLIWNAAYDPESDKITYQIVVNNLSLKDSLSQTNYTITGLEPTSVYNIDVLAKDKYGNSMKQSLQTKTIVEGAQIAYISKSFGDVKRQYGIYLPTGTATNNLPLVVSLHGYGGQVWPDMLNHHFVTLAEGEQFICLMPQGRIDPLNFSYWSYDDYVDNNFISQLIDSVVAEYHVDTERIYLTGHSNSAFMTFFLAKTLENKLAAIAPIAGTLGFEQLINYSLKKPMPLCYIHGTADYVVNVNGTSAYASFQKMLDFFIPNNNVNSVPIVTELPDIYTYDNSTVTKFTYKNLGHSSADIVYYQINNGNHSVPGTYNNSNKDINAYDEIWAFFKTRKLSDK